MPKTRLCKDSTNQPDNDDIFSDFEPPNTTDGSYIGTMKHVKATETHLQRKFEEKLEEVKTRLKAGNCKVGLKVSGSSIQLQATLPPKPDSDKAKPHQQLISLGIPANLDGLKTAEEEAYALGTLIARKSFEWNEKYLGTKQEEVKVFMIGELLDGFESKYFETRPRNIKSENTFSTMQFCLKRYLKKYIDCPYTEVQKIFITLPDCINKDSFAKAVNVMFKAFDIPCKLKRLSKKNITPNERNIPNDEQIVNSRDMFHAYALSNKNLNREPHKYNWQFYQWCYSMIATYGLRPRELFVHPNIDWWLSPENTDNTWKVHKDNKTGEREVFPLYKQWVDDFDLKNIQTIQTLKKVSHKETLRHRKYLVSEVAAWFKKSGLNFKPYDLRHAWAIRAHMLNIPIKVAADNLGHTIDEHTKTYQKWFGRDNRKKAINEAINKKSEVEILTEKLIQSNLEKEQLKLEIERLKLELQYAKLNN